MATLAEIFEHAAVECNGSIYKNYPYTHNKTATGVTLDRGQVAQFVANVISSLHEDELDKAHECKTEEAWDEYRSDTSNFDTTIWLLVDYTMHTMGQRVIIFWPALAVY